MGDVKKRIDNDTVDLVGHKQSTSSEGKTDEGQSTNAERTISIIDLRAFIAWQFQNQRPILKYGVVPDDDLIALTVLFRAWEREAVWKLLLLDDVITYSEARRAKEHCWRLLYDWKHNAINGLAVLYLCNKQHGGSATLVSMEFIVSLNFQMNCIANEIETRVSKHPVGAALVGEVMKNTDFPYETILKLIGKQARKRSRGYIFKPYGHSETQEDREQAAMTAFVEFRKSLSPSETATPRLRLPALPPNTDLPAERSKTLEQLNKYYMLRDIKNFRHDILACLQGGAEKLTERVYQRMRSLDRRWTRAKRQGEEIGNDDVASIELAQGDFKLSSKGPTNQERSELVLDAYKKIETILLKSKKSKRNQIKEALRLMCEQGKTEKEAAELTGLTDRTLRFIKLKLQSRE